MEGCAHAQVRTNFISLFKLYQYALGNITGQKTIYLTHIGYLYIGD